ncbi:structural maintenance of chromosomes protein 3 homolog [Halyomorpha halys]|uniref:structural maintenance of chromosomes protein 3 homolog n=1 Tax=Halyomorpha halys TaxID=286706 RepID=UPI0034D2F579
MAEQQENPIQGALKDMGKSILMKHSLVQTLEVEYKNICKKTEKNLKELEELTTNIYNLEGYLNASNCRLEKYCEKEAEWKNENLSLKQSVDDVKKLSDEAKKIAHFDDTMFDQNVIKLVEGLQKERSLHDSNTTKESLGNLEMMDKALAQETIVVKNMINEQHSKYPFKESEDITHILKNTDLCDSVNLEINKMLKRKNEFLKRLDELKEKVRQLEEEIKILNKRA